jgi:hypothetical protein
MRIIKTAQYKSLNTNVRVILSIHFQNNVNLKNISDYICKNLVIYKDSVLSIDCSINNNFISISIEFKETFNKDNVYKVIRSMENYIKNIVSRNFKDNKFWIDVKFEEDGTVVSEENIYESTFNK